MSENKSNDDAQFYSDLLRVFFDSTNDAIFVLCDEMKFLTCNKMTQQWLGMSENVLAEHNNRIPITELLGDQNAVKFFRSSFEQALGNKEVIFETKINPENGKQRWIELNLQRVNIENGDMVIVVARDITGRKKSEAEKERLQRELSQSQKMDALGKLTAGISHDFNNVLGIISGYSELAINCHKNQHKPIPINYLENIFNSTERATKLIAQLMAFSRSDTEQSSPLQLAPLIEKDINMLRATMPSSIEFEIAYQDNIPNVMMEPVKLQQLLLNICINARDAMNGSGKIKISVGLNKYLNNECSFCHERINGEWVEIIIADTGAGIEDDVIKRIFDPFFTTKKQGMGSGMGLTMVSGIVESHNGHIFVASKQNVGTSVHVLFPPAIDGFSEVLQEDAASANEEINAQGESVLIVDDEPALVDFMSDMLAIYGYKCTSHTSSLEALNVYKSSADSFDLVITDQTMPGLTGEELISEIRKIKPEQAIILATGYSEKTAGTEDGLIYLQKPVNTKKLLTVMRQLLKAN